MGGPHLSVLPKLSESAKKGTFSWAPYFLQFSREERTVAQEK